MAPTGSDGESGMDEGQATEPEPETEAGVERAAEELRKRFANGGCMARVPEFSALLTDVSYEQTLEALRRLTDDGVAELECLADGTLVFYFPRR